MILTPEQARWMLEHLTLIREFEERLKRLVEHGVPVGAVHLYVGQEAVAVGMCAALRQDDWIASTHRGHGHCIAKGVDVRAMMAELYGKVTGTNRGKGGSMHITDVTKGMLGVNPIVGAGAAHAIGAGLSAKVRKTDQVCATFFGEGAAGIGTLHEAMNMAAIWKLPVVFVCENNRGLRHARRSRGRAGRGGGVRGGRPRGRARSRRAGPFPHRVQDLSLLRSPSGRRSPAIPDAGRRAIGARA